MEKGLLIGLLLGPCFDLSMATLLSKMSRQEPWWPALENFYIVNKNNISLAFTSLKLPWEVPHPWTGRP